MAKVNIVIEDKVDGDPTKGCTFQISTDPSGQILESEYMRSQAFQCLGVILGIMDEHMKVDISQLELGKKGKAQIISISKGKKNG